MDLASIRSASPAPHESHVEVPSDYQQVGTVLLDDLFSKFKLAMDTERELSERAEAFLHACLLVDRLRRGGWATLG